MAEAKVTMSLEIDQLHKQLVESMKDLKKIIKEESKPLVALAKSMAPVGDPTHNPTKKPLSKTIATKVVEYPGEVVGFTSSKRPAGAHAHLVQLGHEVIVSHGDRAGQKPARGVTFARPDPFMERAIDILGPTVDLKVQIAVSNLLAKASKKHG